MRRPTTKKRVPTHVFSHVTSSDGLGFAGFFKRPLATIMCVADGRTPLVETNLEWRNSFVSTCVEEGPVPGGFTSFFFFFFFFFFKSCFFGVRKGSHVGRISRRAPFGKLHAGFPFRHPFLNSQFRMGRLWGAKHISYSLPALRANQTKVIEQKWFLLSLFD